MQPYSWSDLMFYGGIVLVGTLSLGWFWATNTSLSATPPTPDMQSNMIVSNAATVQIFSDVPAESPLFPAVMQLVRQGIIQGYQDLTFRPESLTNRSEALKALLKSSPLESGDIQESFQTYVRNAEVLPYIVFPDVQQKDWFAPYVYKAYTVGVIDGNPTGEFEAYRPVTLSEFLKMLLVMERERVIADDTKETPFALVPSHAWYTPYFVRAKEIGLLPLDDNDTVNPHLELTRGYMTRLLFKYMQMRHQ